MFHELKNSLRFRLVGRWHSRRFFWRFADFYHEIHARWFNVTLSSPSWRSKGHLTIPKRPQRIARFPETNSSPLKISHLKGKLRFQPSSFRCFHSLFVSQGIVSWLMILWCAVKRNILTWHTGTGSRCSELPRWESKGHPKFSPTPHFSQENKARK